MPSGLEGLQLKSGDLHGKAGFQAFVNSHFSVRDYFIVIGKYCKSFDSGTGEFSQKFPCGCCKPVKMPGPIWESLSQRKPLLPDPEPMSGTWLKYDELVAQRVTSDKYRPSRTEKTGSNIPNRKKVIKAETVRSFIRCTSPNCGKLRCIYSLAALDTSAAQQLADALQDENYCCGLRLLPLDHPLSTCPKPVFADDQLSCAAPMEVYYYHTDRPKTLTSAQGEWPIVCYHCGSPNGAYVDQDLVQSDMYASVMPICPQCKEQGKVIKTTNPAKAGDKQCSAPSCKKRNAQEAELRQAEWQVNKRPVPERDAGEDVIAAIVGKMKQGNKKFVYWSKKYGTLYEKNTCTWQAIVAELDKDDLEGMHVRALELLRLIQCFQANELNSS